MGCLRKLDCPPVIFRIPGNPAYTVERMHPLRQVMEILPVAVPFQALVERLVLSAFGKLLSDPQAPFCRVHLTFLSGKAADPAGPRVVVPVTAKDVVHLVNETQSQIPVCLVMRLAEKFEVVAHRKRIRPQVALRMGSGRGKPGQAGKVQHDLFDKRSGRVLFHSSPPRKLHRHSGWNRACICFHRLSCQLSLLHSDMARLVKKSFRLLCPTDRNAIPYDSSRSIQVVRPPGSCR